VIEQKINEFFGDAESTGFGSGWWSGIVSAFFGFLFFRRSFVPPLSSATHRSGAPFSLSDAHHAPFRLFGTYYHPDEWPERYGLDGEEIPPSFVGQTIEPFLRCGRRAR